MRKLFILAAALTVAAAASAQKQVTLYIAGDSTAQTYNPEDTPMRGWAQELQQFFGDGIRVSNHAIGGRSTGSFIREGRWQAIVDSLQEDDWVMIQFGHNDTSTNPQRHVEPDEYKDNIMNMCADVMAKGAYPIVLTSIVMRTWRDGKLVDERPHFGEYVQLARGAAGEICVPLIDMNLLTTNLVKELGDEESAKLYFHVKAGEHPKITQDRNDDTHLLEAGAVKYAELLVEELKSAKIPLAEYLK